jgi:dihydrofolate synthase/folylpolyglutamate synthase
LRRALTQFDAQVAAAFLLFREHEAGARTCCLKPAWAVATIPPTSRARTASVITPIGSFDHQDALGATLAEIAAHKAGILKSNCASDRCASGDEARK